MLVHSRRSGFTLVELLVVVGIIALLIAILLPSLLHARWQARVTSCASTERQIMLAAQLYASQENGFLPRFDGSAGAGNLHDLTLDWYRLVHSKYNLPDSVFFCPLQEEHLDELTVAGFTISGYEIWIPRSVTGDASGMIPPDPPGGIFPVVGTDVIRGPKRLADPLASRNPIISDDIYLYPWAASNSTTFDVSNAPPSAFYQDRMGHVRFGKLDGINVGYLDGHVERVAADAVRLRYLSGNAWNCR